MQTLDQLLATLRSASSATPPDSDVPQRKPRRSAFESHKPSSDDVPAGLVNPTAKLWVQTAKDIADEVYEGKATRRLAHRTTILLLPIGNSKVRHIDLYCHMLRRVLHSNSIRKFSHMAYLLLTYGGQDVFSVLTPDIKMTDSLDISRWRDTLAAVVPADSVAELFRQADSDFQRHFMALAFSPEFGNLYRGYIREGVVKSSDGKNIFDKFYNLRNAPDGWVCEID